VRRFVYASSSSVYGDSPVLPKREDKIGRQLSPYAVSKYTNELYAGVFGKCYGLETIGLRYFNVFGPRQDPNGPYAAVIPRWIAAIRKGEPVHIYGDGKTSRDFCYVDNAVQANLLAGVTKNKKALNQTYNVACGARTSLNKLHDLIVSTLKNTAYLAPKAKAKIYLSRKTYCKSRKGDVRHSLANISKARKNIGYKPNVLIQNGAPKLVCKNKTNSL
jgi:UDP-N-acetylglucosamine 4-epimerase